MNTLGQWLRQATDQLRAATIDDSPELDAQLLACHGLEFTRSKLFAFPEHSLDNTSRSVLDALLQRRLSGEPIAYITGFKEFWSIPFKVNSGTLVPRADTELLVEKAIELAATAPDGYVLDLGTGCGAIAIAMACELPGRQVLAIEKSLAAVNVASDNGKAHTHGNFQLLRANWLDCIADDTLAMVLTNPPYLSDNDHHLDTLKHEPRNALVSGQKGLADIAHIVEQTVRAAKCGAPLIVEHGYEQGCQVRQLLQDYHYQDIATARDVAGHERISYGVVAKPLHE